MGMEAPPQPGELYLVNVTGAVCARGVSRSRAGALRRSGKRGQAAPHCGAIGARVRSSKASNVIAAIKSQCATPPVTNGSSMRAQQVPTHELPWVIP